jgi:predicted PolB exonuclease-like 3'-5' exonuclease
MGDSWDNMLNAYIKKFPKHQWQLEKNLEQLDSGFI